MVSSFFADVGVNPEFPDGDFVVKPSVGAGSRDAARYKAYETEDAQHHVRRLHDMGRDVIIQPYVSSVDEMGERALIFIDGKFSHAMTKGAMLNVEELDRNALYRWEQMSVAHGEPEASWWSPRSSSPSTTRHRAVSRRPSPVVSNVEPGGRTVKS